jgi:hypothetical protein
VTTQELWAAADMVVATGMSKDWADTIDAGAVAVCRDWLRLHAAADAGVLDAAGDLLAALKGLLALYESDEGCRRTPEYIAGLAAIAKAKGRR